MAVELSTITGALTDIAEMADGSVWISRKPGGATPLLRLAETTRTQMVRNNSCDMGLITGTVDEVAGPETVVGVWALDPGGWALAVADGEVQLWKYTEGAWTLAALTAAGGIVLSGGYDLFVYQGVPYVVTVRSGEYWAQRGLALVEMPPASVPLPLREIVEELGPSGQTTASFSEDGAGLRGPAWWRGYWWGSRVKSPGGVGNEIIRFDGETMVAVAPTGGGGNRVMSTPAALHLFGHGFHGGGVMGWTCLRDGRSSTVRDIYSWAWSGHATGKRLWMIAQDDATGPDHINKGSRVLTIDDVLIAIWVYAREVEGVVGLQVEGAPDPSANGWYHPDGTVNGQTAYVNADGTWWIIWDGTNWILAPYGETSGGFTTILDGTVQGLVVMGAPDPTCDGDYAPGAIVNGQQSWDQVDGDHHIIWDGEKWVLIDGDGTVIYIDGSGNAPWLGIWTDPAGGAGPIVAGRMTPTDAYLEPAGSEVRWLYEPDLAHADLVGEVAVEVRIVVDAPAAEVAQMRALVRVDPVTLESRAWSDYQVLPIGEAGCVLETPGRQVEVALLKPVGVAEPDGMQVKTRRFEE